MEQAANPNMPITWMVRRTGWHELPDGAWRYVRAAAGDDEPVRAVGLPSRIVQASAPPEQPATEPEVVAALGELARHGWGPILGLSVGVRALAQSIVPVLCPLLVTGKPNSGKTLTACQAQAVVMSPGFPPLMDASFADTPTSIEIKLGQAGDRAVTLDDMPLTASSTAGEERTAREKFDSLVRAVFAGRPLKDRGTRDLGLRESTLIRGLPVITAQRVPPHVQASALRRIVLADFPSDAVNDGRWFETRTGPEEPSNFDRLVPAWRQVGDRVIERMAAAGRAGAAAWVAECDELGRRLLDQHGDLTCGVSDMGGVVKAAGQMVGGLVMIADAFKADVGDDDAQVVEAGVFEAVSELVGALGAPLAESLRRQAQRITDRQATDTGVAEALGEILLAALYGRRAHIRDATDDRPRAVVPDQPHQAQGLREPGDPGAAADGAPLYWLPERGRRGALGIGSADLHMLVKESRDPRLDDLTARSLPRWLLDHDAVLASTQRATRATTKVRVADRCPRLVLVPVELVYGPHDDDQDDDGPGRPPAGPERPPATPERPTAAPEGPQEATEPPADTQGPERPPATPERPTAAPEGPQEATEPPADTQGPERPPATPERPTAAGRGRRGPVGGRSRGGKQTRGASRGGGAVSAPAAVLVVEDGHLLTTTGGRHRLSPAGTQDLAALLVDVARVVPAGPAVVLIAERAHRGYGLPERAPRFGDGPPRVLRALTAAGWHRPGHPGVTPWVTRAVTMAHPERTGTVRLVPVAWIPPDEFPRYRTEAMQARREFDPTDALGLARRLEAWRAAVGWDHETSTAATGVRMLRDLIERSAIRMPLWRGSAGKWPMPVQPAAWQRPLTDDEAASATHVLRYDARRAYLASMRQAIIAGDDLQWERDPQWDKNRAGLWRIIVPPPMPSDRLVPAPVVDVEPSRDVWVTSNIVALYDELGRLPEILEGWTAPAIAYDGLRDWQARVRDLVASDTLDPAIRAGAKALYQSLHGKLRDSDQGVIRRPDWGWAIRDAAWCSVVRRCWQTAGLVDLPKRTYGPGVRAARPWAPIAIRHTDELDFAAPGPEAGPPEGVELGDHLGAYRPKPTVTLDQWQEAAP